MLNPLWTRRLAALWACCAVAVCHADLPSLGPQQGVLVLRNGRVLRGEITQVGDRFTIAIGDTDEVAVPVASVELRCASLEDAYRRKAELLVPGNTAAGHLALANWCLANELLPQAAEQIMVAQKLEPENAEIVRLERRLHLAARQGQADTGSPPAKSSSGTAKLAQQVDLDKFTQDLPPGTVEHFTTAVQPLLVNRCGASGCHGPNAATEYNLMRPTTGRLAARRFTQRNLVASMRYVDRENPLSSQLILQAIQAHGNARQAPIDTRETESLRQLASWLQRFQQVPTRPAKLDPISAVLSQPDAGVEPTAQLVSHGEPVRSPSDNKEEVVTPVPTAGEAAKSPSTTAATPSSALPSAAGTNDPFDPEIFNRRYHPRAERGSSGPSGSDGA